MCVICVDCTSGSSDNVKSNQSRGEKLANFKGQRSHVHVSCERKGVVFHGKEQFTFSLPVDIYKQVLGQGEQVLVSLWTEQMPF